MQWWQPLSAATYHFNTTSVKQDLGPILAEL